MQFTKFKALTLSLCLFCVFLLMAEAKASMFDSRSCLTSKFETKVEYAGRFFGLLTHKLSIKKDVCKLNIKYKELLEESWEIDLCRIPIHIKYTSKGSLEVYKRLGECTGEQSNYCESYALLKETLQDSGLVFAKGEREKLETSHGQTYCTYLLVNNYLGAGKLFSKYDHSVDIFSRKKDRSSKSHNSTRSHTSHGKNVNGHRRADKLIDKSGGPFGRRSDLTSEPQGENFDEEF